MNSQNTPVHIKLWHREFWQLAIANLLLSMSVYMFIPVLPVWLMQEENFSLMETGLSMGVFAFGLYLLGPFVSFLVQHYRRNKVCLWAILLLIGCEGTLWYIDTLKGEFVEFWIIMLQRFLLGALFGFAQMVLASTLVIDTCESFQRTEANHSASWFGRFALSLGPLTGLVTMQIWGFNMVIMVVMGLAFLALLLIRMVVFPFRAPEDHVHVFSCDRFLLDHGSVLFLNLLLITIAIGLCIGQMETMEEFGMMMIGFLLALLAQRFMFRDAELKSEVVTGLILLSAALLINMTQHTSVACYISSTFIGMSTGIIGTRFLLFLIKLSRHCQRGTSQSSFMLSWETGLALGVGLTYVFADVLPHHTNIIALALTVVALLMYHTYTHSWFLRHKNR
ncbi:MAG: MFS transporter [Prevotella sp.]|nr:MFS transporter [Prevotella sp.]